MHSSGCGGIGIDWGSEEMNKRVKQVKCPDCGFWMDEGTHCFSEIDVKPMPGPGGIVAAIAKAEGKTP